MQIAFLHGAKAELDLMPLMLKRLALTGSTLRARSLDFKAALARAVEQNVWPLVEAAGCVRASRACLRSPRRPPHMR